MESMTMHNQALVLQIFVIQRGYNSLWSSVWRCPIAVHSLKYLTLDQCLKNTAAFSLSCNENSDALKSSKILLCIMGRLLQIPVGKLRQTEAKRKLSLYYVQQTLILKVSRHGWTLGKKKALLFPRALRTPLQGNNILLQLKWAEQHKTDCVYMPLPLP